MANYRTQIAVDIARQALSEGLRVWISNDGNGDYGFFSDIDGKRVVSFGTDLGIKSFHGNYGPPSRESGTGWGISNSMESYNGDLKPLLSAMPPSWCGRGWKYFTTVEQHLKDYGKSSKYKEVTVGDLTVLA